MKLTILPLDSRPCTYDIPRQLAGECGVKVSLPPRDMMDYFKRASSFTDISRWLMDNSDCDEMIVSADQLVYGGLIASRSMDIGEEEALQRLFLLEKIKDANPRVNIWLFNVIMRTTISTLKKEDQIWWEKVAEYTRVAVCDADDENAVRRKRLLEQEIPPYVLDTFLKARKRNHKVNKKILELTAQGTIRELLLLQEDSSPEGMHKKEQQSLLEMTKRLDISDRVHLHCGTDEAAAALTGRLIHMHGGSRAALGIEWFGGIKEDFRAAYEDRPFVGNLEAYLVTCGMNTVDSQYADTVMLIYAPKHHQRDLAMESEPAGSDYGEDELNSFCDRIACLLEEGKQTALLDIHHANGGESALIRQLAERNLLHRLCGYAGWNTACNSLGTLLGQLLCLPYASPASNRLFTCIRLLDDWLYQRVVRRRLNAALIEAGEDIWNIKDMKKADRLLDDMMRNAPEIAVLKDLIPETGNFETRLIWPRTFECGITFKNREKSNEI